MNALRQIVGSDAMPSKRDLFILAIGALFVFLFCVGLADAQQAPPAKDAPEMQACLERELKKAPKTTSTEIRQTCERQKQASDARANALLRAMLSDIAKREAEDAPLAKSKAEACKKRGWTSQVCADIAAHRIIIGMTDAQVRESRGGPDKINQTVTANGVHEQWVYSSPGPTPYSRDYQYLYFTNGILTSYQLSR